MYRRTFLQPFLATALLAVLLGTGNVAHAGTSYVYASDSGWYSSTGYHDPSNTNYMTGDKSNNVENRSFFVFSIPSSMGNSNRTITNVRLDLYNPDNGYTSPNLTERFNATYVSTSVATLVAGGSGLTSIFTDLGVGSGQAVYGQTVISAAQGGELISIDLSSTANSNVRSHAGSDFAVGGALDTLGVADTEESVFGYSGSGTRRLVITYADADLHYAYASFGNTLVGTSRQTNVMVANIGDTGSTLTGSIGASSDSEITPTSGTISYSLGASQSTTRTYTYAPTERGYDNTIISITSNDGNVSANLQGNGVAPVETLNASAAAAGNVRIGTSATVSITVQNAGDGNLSGAGVASNLRGTFGLQSGSSEFSGTASGSISLGDGAAQVISYSYAPTDRTADSRSLILNYDNGSDNGRNLANTQSAVFTGTGVGPEYASSIAVGSTIDFGTVPSGDVGAVPLTLSNLTPDGDLGPLTDLTIVDVLFSGPDSALFSLGSSIIGTVLAADESVLFDVLFEGDYPFGPRTATLTIVTDQNAPLGSIGASFSYDLQGMAVPEPSSLALLGLGALGLICCRRRRQSA